MDNTMNLSHSRTVGQHAETRPKELPCSFWTFIFWGFRILVLIVIASCTSGCGTYMAHLMARSPNRYPTWFAPPAPVTLAFSPKFLTNFATHFVEVGPPPARLCYRIVNPADYDLEVSSTNWLEDGKKRFEFTFKAALPAQSNLWTLAPRGTVVLLHGYGLAQFSMAPWALQLGQEGWRCVLVDLRGHGKSTGKQIYFGIQELHDLTQLLDELQRDHQLAEPVSVIGESYGAALALRWEGMDSRIRSVVAIAPYGSLSNAVLNIRREYADWMPAMFIKSGLAKLPSVLQVQASELDTTTVLKRKPVVALFVAGTDDKIAPAQEVKQLCSLAANGSKFLVVPGATHESLTYCFSDLVPPILAWLETHDARHATTNPICPTTLTNRPESSADATGNRE
jgi:pimeloyl-ACP methyl ester carboxylesterase